MMVQELMSFHPPQSHYGLIIKLRENSQLLAFFHFSKQPQACTCNLVNFDTHTSLKQPFWPSHYDYTSNRPLLPPWHWITPAFRSVCSATTRKGESLTQFHHTFCRLCFQSLKRRMKRHPKWIKSNPHMPTNRQPQRMLPKWNFHQKCQHKGTAFVLCSDLCTLAKSPTTRYQPDKYSWPFEVQIWAGSNWNVTHID